MKFDMSETGQGMLQLQDDLAKQYGYKVQPPLIAQENIQKYYDELPEDFKMGELISNLKGGGMAFDVKKVWDSFAHGVAGSFNTHGEVEEGYETAILPLYSLSGTKIADRYDRVIIGQYGAFIEIDPKDMCMDNIKCEKGQEYRINNPYYASRVKYQWFTTDDDTHTKLYNQQRGVVYADYQPNKWYVSPYEVCTEEQMMKLRGFDKMYSFDTLDEEGKHPFYRDNFYFNNEVGDILHTTWDFVEGTMFEEEKISDTRFADYMKEAESDNHTVLCKVVEIIGNAVPEADGYMQYPIPVNTHGELHTDKNGNGIFLDGQGGVLVNGIPVPPETIVYDPNDPTRPLYKPELAGTRSIYQQYPIATGHCHGEVFTDRNGHTIVLDGQNGVFVDGKPVPPETIVYDPQTGQPMYVPELAKTGQEQAREMRTFDKSDISQDNPQKETARLARD